VGQALSVRWVIETAYVNCDTHIRHLSVFRELLLVVVLDEENSKAIVQREIVVLICIAGGLEE